ncbi:MAG TPA: hypothetical protein VFB81_14195 [Myxococcales bacterium]|nr:hypothetical protein [Myxococcales bacterium]
MARSLSMAGMAVVIAASAGCIVPRSAGYGFTAVPLAPGAADVGLSVGGIYQQETSAPQSVGSAVTTSTSRQTQIPAFEANAQLGITDQVSLNLHASQAGIQPGVKILVVKDPVLVSVVPQIGGGFVSRGASTSTTIGGGTTTAEGNGVNSFTFLGGVRAVVSLPVGLYGGLGYDFQYISQATRDAATMNVTTATSQAHNVGGAIGYELRLGGLALRPELAVLFTPLAKNQANAGGTTSDQPDTGGLFLFPNVTVAAVSSGK